MATIQNDRDVLLQAAGTRLLTVALPTNQTVDFSLVNGATKPSNNADVTVTAITSGVSASAGGITLSSTAVIKGGQSAYNTGTGFFLGGTGAKFSIGNSAGQQLTWDGSTFNYVGALTGTGSINITGTANFGGAAASGGITYAVTSNLTLNAQSGLLTKGSSYGMQAAASDGTGILATANGVSGNVGVQGQYTGSGTDGIGLVGIGKTGVWAKGILTGDVGLKVTGLMTIDNTTLVTNLNADLLDGLNSGNSSGNIPVSNGTLCTNLNAEKLSGNLAANFVLYTGTVDTGNPGTPTHALHCIIGATSFRIPVLIP